MLQSWFAANTGPSIDASTPYSGTLLITTQAEADALVGTTVTGDLTIRGAGLELHDFIVNGWIDTPSPGYNDIEMHHVTVAGPGTIDDNHAIKGASWATGYHIHHCDISGFVDGIRITIDALVEYNWIHDLVEWDVGVHGAYDGSDVLHHSDGIQFIRCDGAIIRRNYIDQHDGVNLVSGILLQAAAAPIDNVTIVENYIKAGDLGGSPASLHIHQPGDIGFGLPTNCVIGSNLFGYF